MIVQCSNCDQYYDDEFRSTVCPHDAFPANDGRNNFVVHDDAYLSARPPKAGKKIKTYWNGESCRAEQVLVLVADTGFFKEAWFKPYIGTWRKAVEIVYGGDCFYIDDEDGSGWLKVTKYKGSPNVGHRSLEIDESAGVYIPSSLAR